MGKKSHRSATSSSPAPVVPRLPVPPAPWHPLIDYWLVVYREKIAISMLGLDILAGQGEGSSELAFKNKSLCLVSLQAASPLPAAFKLFWPDCSAAALPL